MIYDEMQCEDFYDDTRIEMDIDMELERREMDRLAGEENDESSD